MANSAYMPQGYRDALTQAARNYIDNFAEDDLGTAWWRSGVTHKNKYGKVCSKRVIINSTEMKKFVDWYVDIARQTWQKAATRITLHELMSLLPRLEVLDINTSDPLEVAVAELRRDAQRPFAIDVFLGVRYPGLNRFPKMVNGEVVWIPANKDGDRPDETEPKYNPRHTKAFAVDEEPAEKLLPPNARIIYGSKQFENPA